MTADIPQLAPPARRRNWKSHATVEYLRAKAQLIREYAWQEATKLIERNQLGDAYRLMREACAEAWGLEQQLRTGWQ